MKRLSITQRADDFDHGKPYMVTNLDKVISSNHVELYIRPDEIEDYLAKGYSVVGGQKPNAFGNIVAKIWENVYETKLFKTLKEAEEYVRLEEK